MKVIGSDYDGTLNQGRVSQEDIDALKEWRKAGNLFGVITGRRIKDILYEMRYYNMAVDFLLCNNGCSLYDGEGTLLESQEGDGGILRELCALLIAHKGLHVAITDLQQRRCVLYEGQNPEGDKDPWITLEQTAELKSFTQVDTHFHREEDAASLAKAVNEQFHGKANALQNGVCVDIVPYGVGKAEGLSRYLRRMGVPHGQAFTVGDNFNDLDMLLAFKGYAIVSGRPEVAQKVGRTCHNLAELTALLAER